MNRYETIRDEATEAEQENAAQVATLNGIIDARDATVQNLVATVAFKDATIEDQAEQIRKLEAQLHPLPLVQAVSAEVLRSRWRACDRPNSPGLPYSDRALCIGLAKAAHYAGTRGFLVKGTSALVTAQAIGPTRSWCATLIPAGPLNEPALRAKIAWAAANPSVASAVGEFEGPNEWNNDLINWSPADVIRAHWVMRDETRRHPALAHVELVGASLHDVRNAERDGADYGKLTAARWTDPTGKVWKYVDLIDLQAMHAYPKGDDLDTGFTQRAGWIRAAGILVPIVITETGWQLLGGDPGGVRVDEQTAAGLAQRAVFIAHQLADQGLLWASRYELRIDAQGNDRWGVVAADGRKLPEYSATAALLGSLVDMGATEGFVPEPVGLTVEGDCNWILDGRSDGTYVLHLWSADSTPRAVTVTDSAGSRPVNVTWVPVHEPISA